MINAKTKNKPHRVNTKIAARLTFAAALFSITACNSLTGINTKYTHTPIDKPESKVLATYAGRALLDTEDRQIFIKSNLNKLQEVSSSQAAYDTAGLAGAAAFGGGLDAGFNLGTGLWLAAELFGSKGDMDAIGKRYVKAEYGDIKLERQDARKYAVQQTKERLKGFAEKYHLQMKCIDECNTKLFSYQFNATDKTPKLYSEPSLFFVSMVSQTKFMKSPKDALRDAALGFTPAFESQGDNGFAMLVLRDVVRDSNKNIFLEETINGKSIHVRGHDYSKFDHPIELRLIEWMTKDGDYVYGDKAHLAAVLAVKGNVFATKNRSSSDFVEYQYNLESIGFAKNP